MVILESINIRLNNMINNKINNLLTVEILLSN